MAEVKDPDLKSHTGDVEVDTDGQSCDPNDPLEDKDNENADSEIMGEFTCLPSEIFSILLLYLDTNSLMNCRFLNRTWDMEAFRTLTKRTGIYLEKMMWKKCGSTWRNDIDRKLTLLENLLECLKNTKYPNHLMKKLSTSGLAGTWPEELEVLLKQYGMHIENFNGSGMSPYTLSTDKKPFFHKLLTSWCRNLKEIDICLGDVDNDKGLNYFANFNPAAITNPLSLERIRIIHGIKIPEPILKWIIRVINESPSLKSLHLVYDRDERDEPNFEFYTKILQSTNLASQLKEFKGKLLSCHYAQYNEKIVNFYSSLNRLEKLELESRFNVDFDVFRPKRCSLGMRKSLKELICTRIETMEVDRFTRQGLLNCIEYFPNLDLFRSDCTISLAKADQQEFIFRGLKQPHANLRKLILLGVRHEIVNVEGLEALVKSFPNLQFFHLNSHLRNHWNFQQGTITTIQSFVDESLTVPQFMATLSKLDKLQELNISVFIQDVAELENGLLCLPAFKSLKYLSIYRERSTWNWDGYEEAKLAMEMDLIFTESLKNALLLTKNLNYFYVMNAKFVDQQKCLDFVEENSIPLKLTQVYGHY